MPSVPAIYSPRFESPVLGWQGRALAGLVSLACLAVLVLASQLVPNANGTGTHEQIGLNPCQFHLRTGIPCPSCGMTTSFAYFAHGRLAASVFTQPMGAVLAVLAAVVFWGGAYITVTGRPAYRIVRFIRGNLLLWTLVALTVAAWGWKILIQLNGWDGWV